MGVHHEIQSFGSAKSMDSLWLARPKPKLLLIRVILNQIH